MISPNMNPYKHRFADDVIYKAMRKAIPRHKRMLFSLQGWYRQNDGAASAIGVLLGLLTGLILILIFSPN